MKLLLAFFVFGVIFLQAYGAHHMNRRDNSTEIDRAAAVVETFQTAWDGYKEYAFPNDELHPVTNSFGNPR